MAMAKVVERARKAYAKTGKTPAECWPLEDGPRGRTDEMWCGCPLGVIAIAEGGCRTQAEIIAWIMKEFGGDYNAGFQEGLLGLPREERIGKEEGFKDGMWCRLEFLGKGGFHGGMREGDRHS